jgi:hypothetical protein
MALAKAKFPKKNVTAVDRSTTELYVRYRLRGRIRVRTRDLSINAKHWDAAYYNKFVTYIIQKSAFFPASRRLLYFC